MRSTTARRPYRSAGTREVPTNGSVVFAKTWETVLVPGPAQGRRRPVRRPQSRGRDPVPHAPAPASISPHLERPRP
jgi:hypothetical protein